MKILLAIICMAMLSGCAVGRILQTEEGRKFLINTPEIKAVLRSDTIMERTAKWCDEVDPLLRYAVRMELIAQRTYLPVLSDEDACDDPR